MYRVQYLCPRQSMEWQWVKTLFWVRTFDFLSEAVAHADGLIWRYHSARVIGPAGSVEYVV